MYDKIKLWLPSTTTASDLTPHLVQTKVIIDSTTGTERLSGNVENVRVTQSINGVTIEGSFPKMLYGDNAHTLTRHATSQAVEKLCDTLHLDVREAKVLSLEFASTFIMKKPVGAYLRLLGAMPRYNRMQLSPTSVYYKTCSPRPTKIFQFYDKGAEAAASGAELPKALSPSNLLRYEMRLRRVAQIVKLPTVEASTLSEFECYKRLVELWQQHFFSITKHPQKQIDNMSDIKTVSDAFNALVAQLITQGDKSQIEAFIEQLKEAQVFPDRKYYTRLKERINKAVRQSSMSFTDEDIKELEDEVRQAGTYL